MSNYSHAAIAGGNPAHYFNHTLRELADFVKIDPTSVSSLSPIGSITLVSQLREILAAVYIITFLLGRPTLIFGAFAVEILPHQLSAHQPSRISSAAVRDN